MRNRFVAWVLPISGVVLSIACGSGEDEASTPQGAAGAGGGTAGASGKAGSAGKAGGGAAGKAGASAGTGGTAGTNAGAGGAGTGGAAAGAGGAKAGAGGTSAGAAGASAGNAGKAGASAGGGGGKAGTGGQAGAAGATAGNGGASGSAGGAGAQAGNGGAAAGAGGSTAGTGGTSAGSGGASAGSGGASAGSGGASAGSGGASAGNGGTAGSDAGTGGTAGGSAGAGGQPARPNFAFVSSTTIAPSMVGAQADTICQKLADDAGLGGTFVAWLSSTAGGNAIDKLTGSRGWVRTDGKPFVDTPAGLVAGKIFYPLRFDEKGTEADIATRVMTATTADGLYTGEDCGGFASGAGSVVAGEAFGASMRWTDRFSDSCATPSHLYCFEVGRDVPVAPAPVANTRKVFVTDAPWDFSTKTGLAEADARCAAEAGSGQWVAFLATSTASAASRLTPGSAWARPDGVVVTDPAGIAAPLQAAPNVTPTLAYVASDPVYTGVTGGVDAASSLSCDDWTNVNTAVVSGYASTTVGEWHSGVTDACSSPSRIYCFEK